MNLLHVCRMQNMCCCIYVQSENHLDSSVQNWKNPEARAHGTPIMESPLTHILITLIFIAHFVGWEILPIHFSLPYLEISTL